MRLVLFAVAVVLALANISYGTCQVPEVIYIEGKKWCLPIAPMAPYLEKHPEARPKTEVRCSGGGEYIASYEFKDSVLVLRDFRVLRDRYDSSGARRTEYVSLTEELRPPGGDFVLDWVSGLIVLNEGFRYLTPPTAPYIVLEMDNGRLREARAMNHRELQRFIEAQLEAFRETDEYEDWLDQRRKEGVQDFYIHNLLRLKHTERFLVDEDIYKDQVLDSSITDTDRTLDIEQD